ncbi:Ribokinase, partial [Dysosmobacter welbionis]
GRQQELHQDHRRPYRQVCPGVLPVRLQEDRRRHHQPPAFRRLPHQVFLLHQQGRLRGLP